MELTVARGELSGVVQTEGAFQTVQGFVASSGQVQESVFMAGIRAAAVMSGSFGDKSASGRWVGETCEGTWQLWRFGETPPA